VGTGEEGGEEAGIRQVNYFNPRSVIKEMGGGGKNQKRRLKKE